MHVIVTHSNADFDAVASMLGAWILYPDAIPVLPPTINRNVRDFVTLYENELPFLRQEDLERKPIDRLTVVDTQHIPDLKKIGRNVAIHIIDHHELQPSPPRTPP
jgi:tRNA nucleotidyltransferase (CCA-adding enzyme)